jgi:hypothetical protein
LTLARSPDHALCRRTVLAAVCRRVRSRLAAAMRRLLSRACGARQPACCAALAALARCDGLRDARAAPRCLAAAARHVSGSAACWFSSGAALGNGETDDAAAAGQHAPPSAALLHAALSPHAASLSVAAVETVRRVVCGSTARACADAAAPRCCSC